MTQKNLPVSVSTNSKVNALIDLLSNRDNKTVYLKELMSKYNHVIDKNLTRDFQDILEQYTYNKRYNYKYIDTLMKKYVSSTISPDDKQYIEKSLSAILTKHRDLYFKNVEIDLLNIQASSINQKDFDEKRIAHINKTTSDYIDYLVRNKEISREDSYTQLYERYAYFPYDMRHIIDEIDFGHFTYKQLIEAYKKRKKEGFTSKYTDEYLHELVLKKKDRIMKLYREEVSYNKIQKQITEECINENLIPATLKRYSRAKNENNKIIDVKTKLPLSGIRKVVADELSKNVIDVI